jgi:predicted unusual protein kinase regulating ubiquinone biosynthesis (AarF/ABC1/UbiB family)
MKAGQILSFVPFGSGVPAENRAIFQAAMSGLQADAPPMAPELAAEVIAQELGASPGEVFAEFSPLPIAAASIGQVHEARLHDGRKVAVKVQYPGAARAIASDLRNAELLAVFFQLLRSVVPNLTGEDPRPVAQAVSNRILQELDYRVEAANQRLFAERYRNHPFIFVPDVMSELSTGRVLTQDFAEGYPWPEALAADRDLRDRWAEVIFRFLRRSLAELHAFNSDPHPGNYLFRSDGSVAFLDFGCVVQLEPAEVAGMQAMTRSAVDGDAAALWRTFVELGVIDASGPLTPEILLEWQSVSFEPFLAPQPFTGDPALASRITEAFTPSGKWGRVVRAMRAPREYIFLSRVQIGVSVILAELRATGQWRDIETEINAGGLPATELGRIEARFFKAQASQT